jgi:hypothetical protein
LCGPALPQSQLYACIRLMEDLLTELSHACNLAVQQCLPLSSPSFL